METINEVLAHNVRKLRGNRTQSEIAEKANLSLRSYQHIEGGHIPQQPNLEAVASALGIRPTALFLDPDYTLEPTPIYALEIIRRALEGFCGEDVSPMRRQVFDCVAKVDESQVSAILTFVEMALNAGPKENAPSGAAKKRAR